MKRGYPVRRLKIKYDSIPIYTGSTGQPKPDNVEFGMGFRPVKNAGSKVIDDRKTT
jgi:hypothetical protein